MSRTTGYAFVRHRSSGRLEYTLEEGTLRERSEKAGERVIPLETIRRLALDRAGHARIVLLLLASGEELLLRSSSFPGGSPEHDHREAFAPFARALIAHAIAAQPSLELRTVARFPFFLGLMLTGMGAAFAGITSLAASDGIALQRIVTAAVVSVGLLVSGAVALTRGRGRRFEAGHIPEGYVDGS